MACLCASAAILSLEAASSRKLSLSSPTQGRQLLGSSLRQRGLTASRQRRPSAISAFFSPQDDPILKEATKEPVAFLGGLVAGLLRLDLSEEPLKEWVERTSKAAGIDPASKTTPEEEGASGDSTDGPTEIVIE